jgi:YbbR domain-containing protein
VTVANPIQRGGFHRFFVHNAGLKVVSLLLAAGLWLAVARSPMAEIEMTVPIAFESLPDNLEIDSASFTQAQVRIRGPERIIQHMQPGDVMAEINLASAQPGERTYDLADRVHVPQDLEVVQIIPGQFRLSFDQRVTRKLDVHPRVTGTFADGLQVAQVIADPSSVTVTGPQRRVAAIDGAVTDPVDASGTLTRATFATHAYVTDPLIQVAHPTLIHVTVIMGSSSNRKSENK